MPDKKKTIKEPLVTNHKSVHVVFFSCAHCGEEVEDIKMCPSCGTPMKVINVVEKFGDEAEKFLAQIKSQMPAKSDDEEEEEYVSIDKEQPNIILMGGADSVIDDGGIDPTAPDDGDGLDIIFPDVDGDDDSHPKIEALDDGELSKALEQLDEEDDTTSEDFDSFGGGEVPEL
jgi:hypothetical protein